MVIFSAKDIELTKRNSDDSARTYKLSHTTCHDEQGFTQAHKAKPHDSGIYGSITEDDFNKAAKTSRIHCSKELYEACTHDGSCISIYCRTGNVGQPSYDSYIDHWRNKWPENYRATFHVFQSVYKRQAALRALQAAKTEEASV